MSWRHLRSWAVSNKWELLLVAVCTAVAAFLRIYQLADLPPGLHGDEALTGLDAIRILDDGWIGPYIGSALGQPTGPLYFTAFIFKLSHPSLFTLRLSMAILGIATVPLAHLLFRISFGRWVAIFGIVALTFSYWHLHYSRIGFMVISMPLATTLGAIAVLWAMRSAKRWSWFGAGLVLGAGVYSYNGYPLFPGAVAVLLAIQLALHRNRRKERLLRYILLLCGFVLAALPLIHLAVHSPDFYFSHHRMVSLLSDPQFAAAENLLDRAEYVARRGWDAVSLLYRHAAVDMSDAMGNRGAMNLVLASLAYLGLLISFARLRSPPYLLAALTVLAGLSSNVVTFGNWGDMRRSLIAVPFVYGLAGVAAWEIVLAGKRLMGNVGYRVAAALIVVVLVVAIAWNTAYYFGDVVRQEQTRWTFAVNLVDSLDAAHRNGAPGTVYFYSGRWSYNYETRLFLYPQTPGIDRSEEFGKFSLDRLDSEPVTYVLLPPYTQELDNLAAMYPDGKVIREYDELGVVRFAVYHLPETSKTDNGRATP